MTRQIQNVVYYRGKDYSLADQTVFLPVVPQKYRAGDLSTACWRGYFCTYKVADNLLFVTESGGLQERVQFTGAMLLGANYIQKLWGMVTPDVLVQPDLEESPG